MKKIMLWTLMVSCLTILLGCSPRVVYLPKEVLVLHPDSLLVDPCEPVGAGETLRSLAKGYVKNTGCIREYKLLLDKQRQFKLEAESIYNGNTK